MAPHERDPILGETTESGSDLIYANSLEVESRKNRPRKVAAAMICALAVTGALPSLANGDKKATPGIDLIGVSSNDIFTDDPAKAAEAAGEIQDLGANAVRIFYPLNRTTAWESYHNSLCNAAEAAYEHNLQLIITFNGYGDNGLGFYPTTLTEQKQFATTATSILWTLASKGDSKNPKGCVPGISTLIFEGINEENNKTFNEKLSDKTPEQAIVLNSFLAKALKKDAAKPQLGVKVLFGEALSVANHDVASFLSAEGQAAKDDGIANPYDFIDIHPYPAKPTDNPVATMNRVFAKVTKIRDQYFPGSRIAMGEYGVNTLTNKYQQKVSSNIGVSEQDQVKYTSDFLQTAANEGVKWVTLFKARDDGGGSMPSSGELYKDGTHKTSYNGIQAAIVDNSN